MARSVFFSFHYENDINRAMVVRNSDVTKKNVQDADFIDKVSFEEIKKKGDEAVKRWIDQQLQGTSVTAVLIGTETATRPYVQYEIQKSKERGNGLLGVYIHNIKSMSDGACTIGPNPFTMAGISGIPTYDWINDSGYEYFGDWVESAYKKAQAAKTAQSTGRW